jgi:hypothetical protein
VRYYLAVVVEAERDVVVVFPVRDILIFRSSKVEESVG